MTTQPVQPRCILQHCTNFNCFTIALGKKTGTTFPITFNNNQNYNAPYDTGASASLINYSAYVSLGKDLDTGYQPFIKNASGEDMGTLDQVKTTDVDEHIDLINTLGDLVDQKEEAKKEKFIETMPTMIQTHVITCKDWVTVKDTVKSLEHIIMKCDPPTPAMPTMATGATVLGLYSHIAHLVDKEEGEIPQPFKGTKPKQTRGRGKPKGKPQEQRQNPPKAQEADEIIHMKTLTITITMLQVRVKAADLIMVKAETDNFEGSYNETEAKDLSIVNVSFKIIIIREAHHNKIILNTAMVISPISRGIMLILIEAMAVDLSNTYNILPVNKFTNFKHTLDHLAREWYDSLTFPIAWDDLQQRFSRYFSTQGRSIKHPHDKW